MAHNGHILPAYRFFAEIEEGLPEHEQCPLCEMWFLQMEERAAMEEHIARCVIRQAERNRGMISMGYKETSKGWVKNLDPSQPEQANAPRIYLP